MYLRTKEGLGPVPMLHGSFRGTLGSPPPQPETREFQERVQEALVWGRSPGGAHVRLERPRFRQELAGLGYVVVSTGEFGNALAWFAKAAAVPDAVFWLLKQSPTFQSIVN